MTASLLKSPGLFSVFWPFSIMLSFWMVSTRPPTSKSSSPFSNRLVTVPNAPITIGIIVTCMFHSFFQFPSKVEVLILLFTFFQFYSVVTRDSKGVFKGCPRGVMVKAMNCGIVVREFVLQSRYYVHFRANTLGKGMNPLILPPAMGK